MPGQTMLDDVANDLAIWIDQTANQVALAFAPARAPFSAQVTEEQKLEFYRSRLFNPDGTPNPQGRQAEMQRLGTDGFANVYKAVIKRYPELRVAPPPPIEVPEEWPQGAPATPPSGPPGPPGAPPGPPVGLPPGPGGPAGPPAGGPPLMPRPPMMPPPGVRAMASGGVVTEPTLALIGEAGPEAVVPLRPDDPYSPGPPWAPPPVQDVIGQLQLQIRNGPPDMAYRARAALNAIQTGGDVMGALTRESSPGFFNPNVQLDTSQVQDRRNLPPELQRRALPPLEAFASGGVVDRPTLALIGEAGPEAVVPLADYQYQQPNYFTGTPDQPPAQNLSPWNDLIAQHAGDYANDPRFLRIAAAAARAESTDDPRAYQIGYDPNNPKTWNTYGGRGLWQFDIGPQGMGHGLSEEQLFDPNYQASQIVPQFAQNYARLQQQAPGLSEQELAARVYGATERPAGTVAGRWISPDTDAYQNYLRAWNSLDPNRRA